MKKTITVLAVLTILLIGIGAAAVTYAHGEDSGYSRTISQSLTLANGSLVQWNFDSDKEKRVRVKVKIEGANLQNHPDAILLVKSGNSTRGKKITAEELKKKKTVSFTLPCKKGQSNYLLLTPVNCTNVQVTVTVNSRSLKGHLRGLTTTEGTDYGLKK